MNLKFNILVAIFLSAIALRAEIPNYDHDAYPGLDAPMPLLRDQAFMKPRLFPFTELAPNVRQKAIAQSQAMYSNKNSRALQAAQQNEWRCIGPDNIGGRVKSLAVHPKNPDLVYAAAAAGGIWRSSDAGSNWSPIFDFESSIAFGGLSIDPNNPNIIYAGSGEAVNGGGNTIYLGSGVYKSIDGGNNWSLLGLSSVGAVSKIFVHPKNSNLIVLGAITSSAGFWKSTDAGLTWKRTFTSNVSDVSINPNDPNEFIIGVEGKGVYFSNDVGETWTLKNTGISGDPGRVSVQMAGSKPNIYYMLSEIGGNGVIYKTTDKGNNWYLMRDFGQGIFYVASQSQAFYDNYLCVHPTNENYVLIGGIDTWQSTDAGNSWGNVTNSYSSGGYNHPDQHCACFAPSNPDRVYLGNDGGVFKSDNAGGQWYRINNNLAITQYYGLAIDNTKQDLTFGGSQDNGTSGSLNNSLQWSGVVGGDGFKVLVHPKNPNILFGENPNGALFRVDMAKGSVTSITSGIPSTDGGEWCAPFAYDGEYGYMYHGRHNMYRSQNSGSSWTICKGTKKNSTYTAIDFSKVSPEFVMAGNAIGNIVLSTDAGDTWSQIAGNGLVSRYVNSIAFSIRNAKTVYVGFSGYGSPHIFKSTDLGTSWSNLSYGLPDVPVNSIALHPEKEGVITIATDIGVYISFNDGQTWCPFGRSLPNSPVREVAFHTNRTVLPQLVLRAATFGRSMWEIDVPNDAPSEPAIIVPSGGEVMVSSTTQQIKWYGFTTPVLIDYTTDNGASWRSVCNGCSGNSFDWIVANTSCETAKMRFRSAVDNTQEKLSNYFTIKRKSKGSIIANGGVSFVPYGIAFDRKNSLWTTSFYSNELRKLNTSTFFTEKTITLPGDSLFTDIAMDRDNGILYVHRQDPPGGAGGKILTLDTNGKLINQFASPAKVYPIGLEYIDGFLYAADRDGVQKIYKLDPKTGAELSNCNNPYQLNYGPRGLGYDGSQYIYQVCTYFPATGSPLAESLMLRMNKSTPNVEYDRMTLDGPYGIINARGIDVDPETKDFWITDFGGNIFKIAGFNTVVEVEEPATPNSAAKDILANIYPNPASDYFNFSIEKVYLKGQYKIEIADIYGEIIGTFFDKYLDELSPLFVSVKTNTISAGVYNVILTVDGKKVNNEKIEIIR
ncbi:MAG: hypothetical protein NT007_06295 [Candidatus Kapabacteria bacterium]|nr:hypothetical protein [Candidatus Kapabacteria bacterium]